jgi:hypothetical protein
MSSPFGESRGGTPEGERALQGARCIDGCGGWMNASFGVPLPFLFLLFCSFAFQWRRKQTTPCLPI